MRAEGGRGTLPRDAISRPDERPMLRPDISGRDPPGRAIPELPIRGEATPGLLAGSCLIRTWLPPNPLAAGGWGTERANVGPRCTPALPCGVCLAGFDAAARLGILPPRAISADGRPLLRPEAVAGAAARMFPRLPAGSAARLTTGRENVRGGGMAVVRPAFLPSMVVLVGRASTVRTALARLSCCGETLTAFRATSRELTSVLRETAVNPFGACMLA